MLLLAFSSLLCSHKIDLQALLFTKPHWLVSWLDNAGQQILQPESLDRAAILKNCLYSTGARTFCREAILQRPGCGSWLADFKETYSTTDSRVLCYNQIFREHSCLHFHEMKRQEIPPWMTPRSTSILPHHYTSHATTRVSLITPDRCSRSPDLATPNTDTHTHSITMKVNQ